MLHDLDTWWPAITVGPGQRTHGDLAPQGGRSAWLVAALLPLVPALLHALTQLDRSPRQRSARLESDTSFHRLRRPNRESIRYLTRHSARESSRSHHDRTVPGWRTDMRLDHPANLYLAWCLRRVPSRLRTSAEALRAPLGTSSRATERQNERDKLAHALVESAQEIEGHLRGSFLGSLRAAPPGASALLAVLDDPRYARIQSLVRRFLSPRFALEGGLGAAPAPAQPAQVLYALWGMLRVQRLLRRLCPGFVWSLPDHSASSLSGLLLRGEGEAGRVVLGLRVPFPAWNERGESPRFGLHPTVSARPSLVLGWRPVEGSGSWAVIETCDSDKPRVLEEHWSTLLMHRGSLSWRGLGGGPRAAVLLSSRRVDFAGASDFTHLEAAGGFLGALQARAGACDHDELDHVFLPLLRVLGLPLAMRE